MHIGHPGSGTTLTLALTGTTAASPQWQAGQVLDARVIDAQRDGTLLLQLEGQGKPVQARSPLPLAVGQQVKLEVALEADRVVLRLLDKPAEQPALQQAWRTALPHQLPLATVLQHIARLMQLPSVPGSGTTATANAAAPPPLPPTTTAPPLPVSLPELRAGEITSRPQPASTASPATPAAATPTADKLQSLALELLNRLPEPQRLGTAEGLRQAVLNSGLFLEARLARGDTTALQEDFRAGLLRLLHAVKEQAAAPAAATARGGNLPALMLSAAMLGELSQQIEGALARVKVQQLHTLGAQTGADPAWLLELPLRSGTEQDILRLRIQREGNQRDGSGAPGWSVRLHFDSAQHGAVDSVVTLLGGKVGVSFWAEQPQTAERLQLRLEELRGQLHTAGLEVEHLRSTVGRAATEEAPVPSGLVNLSV